LAKHSDLPVVPRPKRGHLLLRKRLVRQALEGVKIEPLLDRRELPGAGLKGKREGGRVRTLSFHEKKTQGGKEGGREGWRKG